MSLAVLCCFFSFCVEILTGFLHSFVGLVTDVVLDVKDEVLDNEVLEDDGLGLWISHHFPSLHGQVGFFLVTFLKSSSSLGEVASVKLLFTDLDLDLDGILEDLDGSLDKCVPAAD